MKIDLQLSILVFLQALILGAPKFAEQGTGALGKDGIHFSFPPPERGWTAEAFQSRFSHTDGKIRDVYAEEGRWQVLRG
jgi:hypothetical protein